MTTLAQVEGPSPQAFDPLQLRRPPPGDVELIRHINQALELLHGKWKIHLLFLMARGIHRHSRLLDCLPGASKKVMIDTLRALERDGLVVRHVFAEVPVRVEYSLTHLGWSMTEPLMSLSEWGEAHGAEIDEIRRGCADSASGTERMHVRQRSAAA
jgi:DNA-binding HxlR family transcriptional regulator